MPPICHCYQRFQPATFVRRQLHYIFPVHRNLLHSNCRLVASKPKMRRVGLLVSLGDLKKAEVLVIAVAHKQFFQFSAAVYQSFLGPDAVVIDVKGI